ncbi:TspO/MBR family protein [Ornithinimicrobium kibberense]|uniref:TspO/MBR family protein n=1 Tax=Ornithinimicrobium kibberense TaxID=282060 RepID=A0ABV5V2I6_9MICO|nr:TspO/MBR family protein [Ornithinimicrobium kibberense]
MDTDRAQDPRLAEPPATLTRDRWWVTVAAVVWIVGSLFGTGVIGGGVEQQGDGLFSDSATLIAPMGPAFSIWSVIYLGLAAYVVWQWLPSTARSRWAARTRIPAGIAIALNGLWLLVVQADLIWLSVVVMAGIVVSLGLVLRATAHLPREGWGADLTVSATHGLYLGWICVATCANVALFLVDLGVPETGTTSELVTAAVIAVVVVLAAWLLARTGQRIFAGGLAAAVVWGLAWVAAGRLTAEPESTTVGLAAAVAAVGVAALAVVLIVKKGTDPGRTRVAA